MNEMDEVKTPMASWKAKPGMPSNSGTYNAFQYNNVLLLGPLGPGAWIGLSRVSNHQQLSTPRDRIISFNIFRVTCIWPKRSALGTRRFYPITRLFRQPFAPVSDSFHPLHEDYFGLSTSFCHIVSTFDGRQYTIYSSERPDTPNTF